MLFMNTIKKEMSCLDYSAAVGIVTVSAAIIAAPIVMAIFKDQYMIYSYANQHSCSMEEAKKSYDDYLVHKNVEMAKKTAKYLESPQYYADSNALLEGQEYSWLPFNQFHNLYDQDN